jgi:hypothetical protein
MKVSTLSAVYSALTNYGYADEAVMTDLYNEIHKGDKVKAEKAEAYDAAKVIVLDALSRADGAVTVAELFAEVENLLPNDFTKGKLTYALTHYWNDAVVKVTGKVNAYRKA